MQIQFKDAQNVVFFVDTETLYWAMLDGPADEESSQVIQSGDVTNLNYGRFALTPRTEKDGVATIAIMPLLHGQQVIVALSANAPIKDFTMPTPVNEVTYEIISEKVKDAEPTTGLAGTVAADSDLSGRTEDASLVAADRDGAPELVRGSSDAEVSEAPAAS